MWPTYLPQYVFIQGVSSCIYCYTLDSFLPHWDDLQNFTVVHTAGSPDPACVWFNYCHVDFSLSSWTWLVTCQQFLFLMYFWDLFMALLIGQHWWVTGNRMKRATSWTWILARRSEDKASVHVSPALPTELLGRPTPTISYKSKINSWVFHFQDCMKHLGSQ